VAGLPAPDDIYAHVDEDVWTEQSVLPDEVSEAIDGLTDSPEVTEFAVMGAEAVYEYLESLQKKSDLHFQNFERRQLRVDRRIDILPRLKTRESTKWIFGLRVSSGCKYAFA